MGLAFLIAFAAGGAIAHSPEVLKAAAAPPEVTFKMTHLEGKPLMIRIFYLEDGTLEIPVPPLPVHNAEETAADKDQTSAAPQVVVISNTEDGVHGVLIEP